MLRSFPAQLIVSIAFDLTQPHGPCHICSMAQIRNYHVDGNFASQNEAPMLDNSILSAKSIESTET
jgi:hypothetical protein